MGINYSQSLDYGCDYHIYNRAIDDQILFKDHSDYIRFLDKYKELTSPYFNTFAYCLIPNHFHFIIQVKSENEIKAIVADGTSISTNKFIKGEIGINDYLINQLKRLFSSYAHTYYKKYNRRGAIFSNKVKRIFLNNPDRVRYLIGYVHHNPLHHHISKDYTSWKYSSYNSLFSNRPSSVSRENVFELFGGKENLSKYHKDFKLMKKEEES